jgi:Fic family protein
MELATTGLAKFQVGRLADFRRRGAGGLSASNYNTITGASPATTTRDLVDLTDKGALIRTGQHKHTRYSLNLTR